MTWHLCSVELNREFAITDDDGLVIAYPVTQKAQSLAKWNNKKIMPLTLWEQVANTREQENVRLIVAAPRLFEQLKKAHRFLRKNDYDMIEINEVLDYIIGANHERAAST